MKLYQMGPILLAAKGSVLLVCSLENYANPLASTSLSSEKSEDLLCSPLS